MSCIRTEIFGTNYTDFALVEELELLVTAAMAEMETATCGKGWDCLRLLLIY